MHGLNVIDTFFTVHGLNVIDTFFTHLPRGCVWVAGSDGGADESANAHFARGQSQEQSAASGSGTIRWGRALLLRVQETGVYVQMKETGKRVTC